MKVFWVDEEERAAYSEIVQMKFHDVDVDYELDADIALERLSENNFSFSEYRAFIIDAHMPTFGDIRFRDSDGAIDKSLAGVRLCQHLSSNFPANWDSMRTRTVIYTTLVHKQLIEQVRDFCCDNELEFMHRTDDGSVYQRIVELGWLN
mgnify:CR=1 FL=1|jgi:hypothetical protein